MAPAKSGDEEPTLCAPFGAFAAGPRARNGNPSHAGQFSLGFNRSTKGVCLSGVGGGALSPGPMESLDKASVDLEHASCELMMLIDSSYQNRLGARP
jgi:hypothetical protein